MPDPTEARWWVYWISNRTPRGGSSLRWSLPFADKREAHAWARQKLADGLATLATVWEFAGPGPGRLVAVYPQAARKVVEHYLETARASLRPPPG